MHIGRLVPPFQQGYVTNFLQIFLSVSLTQVCPKYLPTHLRYLGLLASFSLYHTIHTNTG